MSVLIPDYVLDSIYAITPELLKKHGIQAMYIDLDGTMASRHTPLPPETVAPFLQSILDAGIQVVVLSNNKKKRVELFCRDFPCPWLHRCLKPLGWGLARAKKLTGVPLKQTALVGDQIFTDVFCGNARGALTVLVDSLDVGTGRYIEWRRKFEMKYINQGKRL